MISISNTRHHDISTGHRVYGHVDSDGNPGPCSSLHGHNYRIYLTCSAKNLNDLGMIIDFAQIKKKLCNWLDENWDHRFLVWDEDPWREPLAKIDSRVVWVPFNPTVEQMCQYLVQGVGPALLSDTNVELVECTIEETRKCSATYAL